MKFSTHHFKKLKPRTLLYIAGLVLSVVLIHGCGEGSLPPPGPATTGGIIITGGAA
ncbi:MAG: hypothetical protein P8164_14725 [Gammaproteobacteria bacterium]|jgi:hypothetical protein